MTTAAVCICRASAQENRLITRTCPEHDPLSDAQKAALQRHGYNPDHVPRGVTGDPKMAFQTRDGVWVRNRVCYLDDVEIEGHESSEWDNCGCCIHCDFQCSQCSGPWSK